MKTSFPADYVFTCLTEALFAHTYGYIPHEDDPLLQSEEFESLAKAALLD